MWGQIYDRLVALTGEHRTMLVFTNTRSSPSAWRTTWASGSGKDTVAAHHGSMSRELRLTAEERLKAGELKVMVRHRVARAGHRHRRRGPGRASSARRAPSR